MQWRKTRVHLVLGSGGIRCLSYVGAFKALAERDIEIASVSTCSAGTLMGALLCTPGLSLDELETRVIETDTAAMVGRPRWPKPFRLLSLRKWPFSFYADSGIGRAYETIAGRPLTLGELAYRGKPVEFTTAVVDVDHDRILVYSSSIHGALSVRQVVDIAVAAPTRYPPFEAEGRTLIDGVVFSELPVWLAAGLDEPLPIIALRQREAPRRAETAAGNVVEYIVDCFVSAVRSHDHYFTQQLPRVHCVEIDSGEWKSSDYGLSRAERQTLVRRGYAATARMLDDLRANWWQTPPVSMGFTYSDDPHQAAEDRAAELITRYQRKLGRMQRERVFISYSHRNGEWLERLKKHLAPHALQTTFIWDDQRIQPGQLWENQIREALAQARVCVLLVSREYLNSPYVREQELPHVVRLAEREGVHLLWIPLDDSGFQQAFLRPFQALTRQPLGALGEADAEAGLQQAAAEIVRVLSEAPDEAPHAQERPGEDGARPGTNG
jgi:predicted acylesterase/phospholipase RssA